MTKNQRGFSIVEIVIVVVIVGILAAVGKLAFDAYANKDLDKDKQQPISQTEAFSKTPVKSLGFNLDYYDAATGKAGDFLFTKETLYDEYLFMNYGAISPNPDPNGETKANPQPTFLLPLGTKVHAIADGTIYDVKQLYSGDYSVMIDVGNPELYYEMEHVANPIVKKGDIVKAGQVVAEVSPHNAKNNAGLGMFEVGVLKHGNPPSHLCFFDHIDKSVKSELDKKIKAFYKSWEAYKGDVSIYDESSMPTPGCDNREAISDNNDYRKQN